MTERDAQYASRFPSGGRPPYTVMCLMRINFAIDFNHLPLAAPRYPRAVLRTLSSPSTLTTRRPIKYL